MSANLSNWMTVLTIVEVGIAAQPLLNEALDEDKLENGGVRSFPIRWSMLIRRQILQISIYVDMNDISTMSFGRRSTAYPGTANLQEILREELKEHQGEYGEILSEGGSKAFVNRTPDQGVPLVDHQVRSMELKSLDLPSQAPLPAQGKTLVSGRSNHHDDLAKLKGIQSIRICEDPRPSASSRPEASGRESGTRRTRLPAFLKLKWGD